MGRIYRVWYAVIKIYIEISLAVGCGTIIITMCSKYDFIFMTFFKIIFYCTKNRVTIAGVRSKTSFRTSNIIISSFK
jgi:hypothetical protein